MIYQDDSHLIEDDNDFMDIFERYFRSGSSKLDELEELALTGNFKEFKFKYIENKCEEMAESYRGRYE